MGNKIRKVYHIHTNVYQYRMRYESAQRIAPDSVSCKNCSPLQCALNVHCLSHWTHGKIGLVSFNAVSITVAFSKNLSTTLSRDLLYIRFKLIRYIFAA